MKKISYLLKKYDIISVIIMIFITILFMIYNCLNSIQVDIFDYTIFSSIAMIALINLLGKILSLFIVSKYEDSTKLEHDYNKLNKLYKDDNLLTYCNKNNDVTIFPIIQDYKYEDGIKIQIDDCQKMYKLPKDIKKQEQNLLSAHSSSFIYNQLNIRVDDWNFIDNTLYIKTSRTTYFNSLLTNRSMDYLWKNGLTTRQLYAYAPFAPELKSSALSNHLGFNGLVESADGYIPLIKRGKEVSIGKGTYGTSVGASLKTKSALKDNRTFTIDGLMDAIYDEIDEELNIDIDNLIIKPIEEVIIATYRELVEGGKPQLVFSMKSKSNKDEITSLFEQKKIDLKKSNLTNKKVIMDGNKIEWISIKDLQNALIKTDSIQVGNKQFNMTPSAVATIVMYLNYINNIKD